VLLALAWRAIPPNSSRPASFRETHEFTKRPSAAISLLEREPVEAKSVFYSGTLPTGKLPPSIRFPQICRRLSMTITAVQIPAIVALLAGVLILIMPRFLNFIVAVYLILVGLHGLGLFRSLHM
jgi:hypothetical protein